MTAPFADVVMRPAPDVSHVLSTVCDGSALPVPPQPISASTVPVLGVMVTDPEPVPLKMRVQFLAAAE